MPSARTIRPFTLRSISITRAFLLRAFAERFGLPIFVEGTVAKFFYEIDVPSDLVKNPLSFIKSLKIQKPKYYFQAIIQTAAPQQRSVRARFIFVCDKERYDTWLQTRHEHRVAVPDLSGKLSDDKNEPTVHYRGSEIIPWIDESLALLKSYLSSSQYNSLHKKHPLRERIDALAELREEVPKSPASHKLEHLTAFAESRLDIETWAQGIRTADLWSLFQDEDVVKHIRTRIADQDQFFGVMAQLYVWGLIRQRGISCRMQEKESLPDLSLYLAQGVVIPSEVKDIHTSKNPNNLADVIGKANKQIKVVEPNGSGLLFLRIRRSTQAPGKDDGYPADIASHIASCVRCLNPSKYRGVAKIIAFWDDLTIVDARGMPFYAFRRNSVVIEHPAPRKPVPIEGKDLV